MVLLCQYVLLACEVCMRVCVGVHDDLAGVCDRLDGGSHVILLCEGGVCVCVRVCVCVCESM